MNPMNQENKNATHNPAPPTQSRSTAASSGQNNEGQEEQPRFQPPVINLPKGSGTTQCIGKKIKLIQ